MNDLLEVTQKSLNSLPVNGCWMMHKLRKFVDSKINFKASERQILQHSNNASLQGSIRERIPFEGREINGGGHWRTKGLCF